MKNINKRNNSVCNHHNHILLYSYLKTLGTKIDISKTQTENKINQS